MQSDLVRSIAAGNVASVAACRGVIPGGLCNG